VVAVDELVSEHIVEMALICSVFPVGTVVTRLGQLVAPQYAGRAA
jgi:hypothetical protein